MLFNSAFLSGFYSNGDGNPPKHVRRIGVWEVGGRPEDGWWDAGGEA